VGRFGCAAFPMLIDLGLIIKAVSDYAGECMIIVETALERRGRAGKPVRVGIVGAGHMGRGIAAQLLRPPLGMRLVAIANRTVSKAEQALRGAGLTHFRPVTSASQLDAAVAAGQVSLTDDPLVLCDASNIDVVIDATSDIE